MIDSLHIHVHERIMKPLLIALGGADFRSQEEMVRLI
jgi:hypothetical protein